MKNDTTWKRTDNSERENKQKEARMGTLQSNRSKTPFPIPHSPSPFLRSVLCSLFFVLCLSCENPASDNEGGKNNDAGFVAVAGISGVPESTGAGAEIDLGAAFVAPGNATNAAIVWTLIDADSTGVSNDDIADGIFAPAKGVLRLAASVEDGLAEGADFTRDFYIVIEDESETPVNPVFASWTEVEGYAASGGGGHVVFGNGKFVVCNYVDGSVAWSEDGASWTTVSKTATTFGDDYIKYLAYINNQFWAVGKGGKIAKSADGAVWQAVSQSVTHYQLNGIAFGAEKYIIVGEGASASAGGKILASSDGAAWTDITPAQNPFTGKINSIAYGNGRFLAAGNGGKAAVSTDGGLSWQNISSTKFSGNHIMMVTYGDGRFVATSRYGLGSTTHGTAWDWSELWNFTQNPASQDVKVWIDAVLFDGAYFIAGAQGGRIAYSKTAKSETWRYAVDGTPADTNELFDNQADFINGIAYGNGRYIITGGDETPKAAIASE
jgi:hypothetical protein